MAQYTAQPIRSFNMDPAKVLSSGNKYFCEESNQAFIETDYTNGVRSWRQLIDVLENNRTEALRLLGGNRTEYRNWIKRSKDCMGDFELVMLGGDLKPTNEYRVENGSLKFYGILEKCKGYIAGDGLRFENEKFIDEEGKVYDTIEDARHDCVLELRYYDEIDDIEFWHSA